MANISDGERHIISASYHLLKALQSTKNMSNDMIKLLENLDIHLSTMIRLNEDSDQTNREIETRLLSAQHTIMSLHSNHSKIWASNSVTVLEYLQGVSEVQRLIATLENMPLKRSSRIRELLDQAHSILQMAMDRLQNELIYILVQNKQCFEHQHMSLPPCQESPIYEESIISNEDDSIENASQSTETEEFVIDLINPDLIPQIKSIADIMFTSGYAQEFCQAFTGFWRDTLAEYLTVLDIGHLSIDDVLHMEWKPLNSRIKKWRVAIKSMISVYLAGLKRLFDQVLGDVSLSCLIEASTGPVLCLLSFGQAVSIGPHRPEWLYCLLDMYEVLAALIPGVDALFPQGMSSLIRDEFHELLIRLGESIKLVFKDLGNYIAMCSSTTPFTSGGIHPLTRYVVNYILCFAEYGDTLNSLLQDQETEGPTCAVANHLQSLTSILEANLDKKSSLYKDSSLKHIFMMNNIHYMVRKIRSSKISPYFGDHWIRNHVVKYRQHEILYERNTWSSILTLIRDDGKTGKATLKARCRDFTAAFEELYKSQTRWLVPDIQLREEIRISASKIVIQAYRNFVVQISNNIGEKHIKYSEHELGTYILDLLDGSAKSLNRSRKR